MSRGPQSTELFDKHIFQPDEKGPLTWNDELLACLVCPFPLRNAVHVTSQELVADLPPTPEEDVTDRWMGEG